MGDNSDLEGNNSNSKVNPLNSSMQSLDISILLIYPENSGNIGAVSRIMKNFGFEKLILFNPLEDPHSKYAQNFAMHALDVLMSAEIIRCSYDEEIKNLKNIFQHFDIVIGTSAKGFSYQNIKRIPVFLDDLDISILESNSKILVVFGRESSGISNEQLVLMDFLIKIPSNPIYPTLNLSHAVGIVLYSLYLRSHEITRAQVIPASKEEKEILINEIRGLITQVPIPLHKKDRTIQAFKNVFGRAFLSRKERNLVYHLIQKLNLFIENPELIISEKDKAKKLKK